MKISYKALESERIEDAPFCGALISAIDCKFNCKNCFNQSLKNLPTLKKEPIQIIREIKGNPFNKGIILGGLEWTLQLTNLVELLINAKTNGLKTMLYTGNTLDNMKDFLSEYGQFLDYIKCGLYDETQKNINHIEYGVTLASRNQHIYKKGVDY